jgi:type II secretory ATPase GspE/PulE/Tfp pilus assembly ATPase PilB-like protein
VDVFLSAEQDIRKILAAQYQQLGSVEEMLEGLEVTRLKEEQEEVPDLKDLSDEAPITKLVNLIFAQAVRDRASDIHIEPGDKILRIRFRIDGVLYEVPSPPAHLKAAITSRIKVMSNLNIAETRKTQDGHIRLRIEGTDIDIRVSILPTVFGERCRSSRLRKERGLARTRKASYCFCDSPSSARISSSSGGRPSLFPSA